MTLKGQALDHLVVQVSDLEVSASWYKRVLGMTREDVPPAPGQPPRTAMRIRPPEDQPAANCQSRKIGSPPTTRPRGARTPDQVLQHLRAEAVTIVTGPGRRQGALGTLMSVYCRDPDGSLIEIASDLEE